MVRLECMFLFLICLLSHNRARALVIDMWHRNGYTNLVAGVPRFATPTGGTVALGSSTADQWEYWLAADQTPVYSAIFTDDYNIYTMAPRGITAGGSYKARIFILASDLERPHELMRYFKINGVQVFGTCNPTVGDYDCRWLECGEFMFSPTVDNPTMEMRLEGHSVDCACNDDHRCLSEFTSEPGYTTKAAGGVLLMFESAIEANTQFNSPAIFWDYQSLGLHANFKQRLSACADIPTGMCPLHGHVRNWDTSRVGDFEGILFNKRFFNGDISKWDTSRVTSMEQAFIYARAFNVDISNWDVSKVVNLRKTFSQAIVFNADLSKWDVSNVYDMYGIFYWSKAFNGDVSTWDTSKVHHLEMAFAHTDAWNNNYLANWDVSSVATLLETFVQSEGTYGTYGDLSKWDTSKVTNMEQVFVNVNNVPDVSKWDTSRVTSFASMFYGAGGFHANFDINTKLVYTGNLQKKENGLCTDNAGWHAITDKDQCWTYAVAAVGAVGPALVGTEATKVFSNNPPGCSMENGFVKMEQNVHSTTTCNSIQICVCASGYTAWDVSKVTNMNRMFAEAKTPQNLDLNRWDVSSVLATTEMFRSASRNTPISVVKLSNWRLDQVTLVYDMFALGGFDFDSIDNIFDNNPNQLEIFGMFQNSYANSAPSTTQFWRDVVHICNAKWFNLSQSLGTASAGHVIFNDIQHCGPCSYNVPGYKCRTSMDYPTRIVVNNLLDEFLFNYVTDYTPGPYILNNAGVKIDTEPVHYEMRVGRLFYDGREEGGVHQARINTDPKYPLVGVEFVDIDEQMGTTCTNNGKVEDPSNMESCAKKCLSLHGANSKYIMMNRKCLTDPCIDVPYARGELGLQECHCCTADPYSTHSWGGDATVTGKIIFNIEICKQCGALPKRCTAVSEWIMGGSTTPNAVSIGLNDYDSRSDCRLTVESYKPIKKYERVYHGTCQAVPGLVNVESLEECIEAVKQSGHSLTNTVSGDKSTLPPGCSWDISSGVNGNFVFNTQTASTYSCNENAAYCLCRRSEGGTSSLPIDIPDPGSEYNHITQTIEETAKYVDIESGARETEDWALLNIDSSLKQFQYIGLGRCADTSDWFVPTGISQCIESCNWSYKSCIGFSYRTLPAPRCIFYEQCAESPNNLIQNDETWHYYERTYVHTAVRQWSQHDGKFDQYIVKISGLCDDDPGDGLPAYEYIDDAEECNTALRLIHPRIFDLGLPDYKAYSAKNTALNPVVNPPGCFMKVYASAGSDTDPKIYFNTANGDEPCNQRVRCICKRERPEGKSYQPTGRYHIDKGKYCYHYVGTVTTWLYPNGGSTYLTGQSREQCFSACASTYGAEFSGSFSMMIDSDDYYSKCACCKDRGGPGGTTLLSSIRTNYNTYTLREDRYKFKSGGTCEDDFGWTTITDQQECLGATAVIPKTGTLAATQLGLMDTAANLIYPPGCFHYDYSTHDRFKFNPTLDNGKKCGEPADNTNEANDDNDYAGGCICKRKTLVGYRPYPNEEAHDTVTVTASCDEYGCVEPFHNCEPGQTMGPLGRCYAPFYQAKYKKLSIGYCTDDPDWGYITDPAECRSAENALGESGTCGYYYHDDNLPCFVSPCLCKRRTGGIYKQKISGKCSEPGWSYIKTNSECKKAIEALDIKYLHNLAATIPREVTDLWSGNRKGAGYLRQYGCYIKNRNAYFEFDTSVNEEEMDKSCSLTEVCICKKDLSLSTYYLQDESQQEMSARHLLSSPERGQYLIGMFVGEECTITDGLTANSVGNCRCGSVTCTSNTGMFCLKEYSLCSDERLQFVVTQEIASGLCQGHLEDQITDSDMCQFAAGKLNLFDTTVQVHSSVNKIDMCYYSDIDSEELSSSALFYNEGDGYDQIIDPNDHLVCFYNKISCSPCVDGTGSGYCHDANTNEECISCDDGYALASGNTCNHCTAGRYGLNNQCKDCPMGYWSSNISSTACTKCAAGFFGDSVGATSSHPSCKGCLAGFYQEKDSSTACKTCPDGFYQQYIQQTSCSPHRTCSEGRKAKTLGSTLANADCMSCPYGYYQDQSSYTGTTCKSCPLGYGSYTANPPDCAICPPGQYSPGGSRCKTCSIGKYSEYEYGSVSCKWCPLGQYQDQNERDSCKECPDGWVDKVYWKESCNECDKGKYETTVGETNECTDCPAGKYAEQTGASDCKNCPNGFYITGTARHYCWEWSTCNSTQIADQGSTTTDTTCSNCPNGKWSTSISTCDLWQNCPAGRYVSTTGTGTRNRVCTDCPNGWFNAQTNSSTCQGWRGCHQGQERIDGTLVADATCRVCDIGTQYVNSVCTDCTQGQYSDDSTGCKNCPNGWYQSNNARSECHECAAGQWQPYPGQVGCSQWLGGASCQPGTYKVDGTTTTDATCPGCQAGTFSTTQNAAQCVPWQTCPPGTYRVGGSKSTQATCPGCPNGYYQSGSGKTYCDQWRQTCPSHVPRLVDGTTTSDATCATCLSGKWGSSCGPWQTCLPGTYIDDRWPGTHSNDVTCSACGAKRFSTIQDATQCDPWLVCSAGTYRIDGTSMTDATCENCPQGKFADDSTGCKNCPNGWYQSNNARSECHECAAGQWQPYPGQVGCWQNMGGQSCQPGTYKVNGTTTTDATCPGCQAGTFSTTQNAAQCVPWQTCPPGTYKVGGSTSTQASCHDCPNGYYQSGSGITYCDQWRQTCPSHVPRLVDGTTTSDATCATCLSGKWGSSCGPWQTCLPGTYIDDRWPGTHSNDVTCSACGAKRFSTIQDATQCDPWQTCQTGTYRSSPGTTTTDAACPVCIEGTFTETLDATQCEAWEVCQPGTYEDGAGKVSSDVKCEQCAYGQYQLQTGQTECLSCDNLLLSSGETCQHSRINCGGTSEGICSDCQTNQYIVSATCTNCDTCPVGLRREGCGGIQPGMCVDIDGCENVPCQNGQCVDVPAPTETTEYQQVDFVGASGIDDWEVEVNGITDADPTIEVCLGDIVSLQKSGSGHPLKIVLGDRTWNQAMSSNEIPGGYPGTSIGHFLNLQPAEDTTYTYICTSHSNMIGLIKIKSEYCPELIQEIDYVCNCPNEDQLYGSAWKGTNCEIKRTCSEIGIGMNDQQQPMLCFSQNTESITGYYTDKNCLCNCKTGYTGHQCLQDIDECSTGTDNCDINAKCTNTVPGFACNCDTGFQGDGATCQDIDECLTVPCDPNAECTNTAPGFACNCDSGFQGDGTTCQDIDECLTVPCDPNAECTNTAPGFACNCDSGFQGDGTTCQDIDECLSEPCDPNADCTNTVLGVACECKSGFQGDGATCQDIDECLTVPCDPNAECTNMAPGFACNCDSGFQGDGTTCQDIDECFTVPCDPNAECTNTAPGFACNCDSGFQGDGTTCQDIDECLTDPCDTNAQCVNTFGAFACDCVTGFQGDGTTCQDIDECLLVPCDTNAECTNTAPGFSCECNGGFQGDGTTCQDIDECLTEPCAATAQCTNTVPGFSCQGIDECLSDPCAATAQCTNTVPGFSCECNGGYQGNGTTCQDIDECLTDPCDPNAQCVNTFGAFTCDCKAGFQGNGTTCQDIDECLTDPCDPNAQCVNTFGAFTCDCKAGFQGDGTNCYDINECLTNPCVPKADCINQAPGFSCNCKVGYQGNGTTCQDIDECLTDPCDINAQCINQEPGFSCNCKAGYQGDGVTCQDIDECLTGIDNCAEHGQCVNIVGFFECNCDAGWYGSVCNFERDYCAAGPCFGNGNCVSDSDAETYACNCFTGFEGRNCSVNIDDCYNGTDPMCKNGAVCGDLLNDYECECSPGYGGKQCDQELECQCPNGTVGSQCRVNNTMDCVNCSSGFYFENRDCHLKLDCPHYYRDIAAADQLTTCKPNECYCDNGDAASNCFEHGDHYCAACDIGHHLTLGDDKQCEPNECYCVNGTAKEQRACTIHMAHACHSCDEWHHLNGNLCESNVCTCKNGTLLDFCTTHQASMCGACDSGHRKVGFTCVRILDTRGNVEYTLVLSSVNFTNTALAKQQRITTGHYHRVLSKKGMGSNLVVTFRARDDRSLARGPYYIINELNAQKTFDLPVLEMFDIFFYGKSSHFNIWELVFCFVAALSLVFFSFQVCGCIDRSALNVKSVPDVKFNSDRINSGRIINSDRIIF